MIKRITALIIPIFLMMCMNVTAYDVVNLPNSMAFSEALGIFSADEISSATICDIDTNTYRALKATEIKDFYYASCNMTVWRKVNPTPFRGVCINFTTTSGQKISYYFNAGIQIGLYGDSNYICYMPAAADAMKLDYIRSDFYDSIDAAHGGTLWNVCTDRDFLKMPSQQWAAAAVKTAAAKSLVPYDFTDKYESNITREELAVLIANFITVAGNHANMDAHLKSEGTVYLEGCFEDCEGRDEAIDQLYALDIISGKSETKFEPDGLVTRQEAAAFFTRAAKQFMYIGTEYSLNVSDKNKVAKWAEFYVRWSMDKGILSADDHNKIYPEDAMTVQQAITALSRLYDIVTYWES